MHTRTHTGEVLLEISFIICLLADQMITNVFIYRWHISCLLCTLPYARDCKFLSCNTFPHTFQLWTSIVAVVMVTLILSNLRTCKWIKTICHTRFFVLSSACVTVSLYVRTRGELRTLLFMNPCDRTMELTHALSEFEASGADWLHPEVVGLIPSGALFWHTWAKPARPSAIRTADAVN